MRALHFREGGEGREEKGKGGRRREKEGGEGRRREEGPHPAHSQTASHPAGRTASQPARQPGSQPPRRKRFENVSKAFRKRYQTRASSRLEAQGGTWPLKACIQRQSPCPTASKSKLGVMRASIKLFVDLHFELSPATVDNPGKGGRKKKAEEPANSKTL